MCGRGFLVARARAGPRSRSRTDEVAITEPLARELGVEVGDRFCCGFRRRRRFRPTVRSARRSDTSLGRRLRVAAVLPADGLGAVRPACRVQQLPRNAFVPLADAAELARAAGQGECDSRRQRRCEQASDDGAAVAATRTAAAAGRLRPARRADRVADRIRCRSRPTSWCCPTRSLRRQTRRFAGASCSRSSRIWPTRSSVGERRRAAEDSVFDDHRRRFDRGLGPLLDDAGKPIELADDEIVLNRWAADDLEAKVGDTITVNVLRAGEHARRAARASSRRRHSSCARSSSWKRQTASRRRPPIRKLTPELPGVTDQESISDWDLPFELVEKIRPQDEDYWDEYRTTPKAFVSLATAKRLVGEPVGHDQPAAASRRRVPRPTAGVATELAAQLDPAGRRRA